MQFARTIDAYANQEIVCFKKFTPLITEQRTIRLNRILKSHSGAPVLVLKLNSASEKVETHQCWFTSLPSNRHLTGTMRFD